jgi:hypothetical protein
MGFHFVIKTSHLASTPFFNKKSEVYACIYNTEIFDFLIDIIPNEELKALKKYPAEGMFQILPSNRENQQK